MGLFSKKRLVTDPVCGMEIPAAKAAGSIDHDGRTYHFCSASCQAKFQQDPAAYV